MGAALPFQAWCHVPHKGFYHKQVNDWPVKACAEGRFLFVAFPQIAVLSHVGRIGRYLQGLAPKYSSSANLNICSHVERECVVDLSLAVSVCDEAIL